jgi:hypothetical protein
LNDFRGQSVFETSFGGKEVVVIVEKAGNAPGIQYEYKLLATKKTSTMEKELNEISDLGFSVVGLTVSKTTFGGSELVVILKKQKVEKP